MITNVQIFTTQLTVSQYKISSFPIFLFTVTLNTFIKWLAAIGALLFGKHCVFLEVSPACVMECLFLVLPLFFAEHFRSIQLLPNFSAVGNLTVAN